MKKSTYSKIRKCYQLSLWEDWVIPIPFVLCVLTFLLSAKSLTLLSAFMIIFFYFGLLFSGLVYFQKFYGYEPYVDPYLKLKKETQALSNKELADLIYAERNRLVNEERTDILDSAVMDMDDILRKRISSHENLADLVSLFEHELIKNDAELKNMLRYKLKLLEPKKEKAYEDRELLLNMLSKVESTMKETTFITNT